MKKQTTTDDVPPFAIAHVVLRVDDVKRSAHFWQRLGLRPVWLRDTMAILELRGGTHLLLFPRDTKAKAQRTARKPATAAPFDLMADDVDRAHRHAAKSGFRPSRIADDAPGGHRYFTVLAPGRLRVTIYSSHTEGRRV